MYDPQMAVLPTLIAVLGGIAFGISGGGRVDNIGRWRPRLVSLLLIGLVLQGILEVATMRNSWTIVVELEGTAALLAFAILNRRTGGMVLIVAGLTLNLVPTLVNWGMPTERSAAVSAGLIDAHSRGAVQVDGPRHLARSDDSFRWLDERFALPSGQVISVGDIVLQVGYVLTIASVLRRRKVKTGAPGPRAYGSAIAPLGRGPAPRKGPGLHPSRMGPAGVPRAPYQGARLASAEGLRR